MSDNDLTVNTVTTKPFTPGSLDPTDLVFFKHRDILKYNSKPNLRNSGFSFWKLFSFVASITVIGLIAYFGSFLDGHPTDPVFVHSTGWTLAILTYTTLIVISGFMTLVMWDLHDV